MKSPMRNNSSAKCIMFSNLFTFRHLSTCFHLPRCLTSIHNQSRLSLINIHRFHTKSNAADIVWLDLSYCIVNKPANICIDGNDPVTMENVTKSTLDSIGHEYSGKIRHCHQLDKLTSGLLIYGLTKKATTKMNQLIQSRKIQKMYNVIVHGHIKGITHFLIDFPIADKSDNVSGSGPGSKPVQIGNDQNEGRASITECWVQSTGYFKSFLVSMLRVRLWTGRRHQIRVHLSQIGHAVVGDPVYSANADSFDRLYLDAHRMAFSLKNQQIDVRTKSDVEFDKLITNQIEAKVDGVDEFKSLLLNHEVYSHSVLVPFIKKSEKTDIQILVKMDPKRNRWNFVCESKVGNGLCDIAQNAARTLLKEYEYLGSYLYRKSTFCPSEFHRKISKLKGSKHGKIVNMQYVTHHLASNLRRNTPSHCTVLYDPSVIYFLPIKDEVLRDPRYLLDAKQRGLKWMAISDLMHYHGDTVDDFLKLVLSDHDIASLSWLTAKGYIKDLSTSRS